MRFRVAIITTEEFMTSNTLHREVNVTLQVYGLKPVKSEDKTKIEILTVCLDDLPDGIKVGDELELMIKRANRTKPDSTKSKSKKENE